jgi:hypothetical protein
VAANREIVQTADTSGDAVEFGPDFQPFRWPDGFFKNFADFGFRGAAIMGGAHAEGAMRLFREVPDRQVSHDVTSASLYAMMSGVRE